jgi:hypothetical protein
MLVFACVLPLVTGDRGWFEVVFESIDSVVDYLLVVLIKS